MSLDPERYSRSSDELQSIYQKNIAPHLFARTTAQDRPVAIILGGQPGAGKTPLQNKAKREFRDAGGVAAIIGDDLRAALPHYHTLQRADDRTAAFYTDRDSGRLVELAIADAAERRVNVLVEGTMRSPEVVARTLGQFRDMGYRTDARALAVSPELSELGILQRYVAQKESRGYGRMTSAEAHDAALTGMLTSLDRIQDGRLADTLTIYKRGGEAIQRFDLTRPAQEGEPRARAIVEAERARPLTDRERAYVTAQLERLVPALEKYGVIQPARPGPVIGMMPAQERPPPERDR